MRSSLAITFSAIWFLFVAFAPLAPARLSAQPPADASASSQDGTAESLPREASIYIPYDKLRAVIEREGRGVFLPYEKFQELWQAAQKAAIQPPDEGPPVESLITGMDSEATVARDVMLVTAHIKIDVFKTGWIEIPLRLRDAAIRSASIANEPARLTGSPEQGYQLLLENPHDKPREIELTLEYAKAITKSPGQNSITVEVPSAPVNRWKIRIPEAGVKVNVHPMIAATEAPESPSPESDTTEPGTADGASDETVVLAFVGAAPTVQIDWTPKAEGARGMTALAHVEVEQEVVIDEGVTRTRTRLAYTISRAELTGLQLDVPGDHKVVNVFDANVRQWEVEEDEDRQRIRVDLFEPATSTQALTIELEQFRAEAQGTTDVAVPVVHVLGVGRQQGIVAVRLASGLRAQTARRTGLTQIDQNDLPATLAQQPSGFAYRYTTTPFELILTVEKVLPEIATDSLMEVYIEPQQITLELLAIYRVEQAGIYELTFDVPRDFDVEDVRGHATGTAQAAVIDSFHREGEENQRLRVNLANKALGPVGVVVVCRRRLEDPNLRKPTGETSTLDIRLPRVDPTGVVRAQGHLVVYAPESLRVTPVDHPRLRSVPFDEATGRVPSCRNGRYGELAPIMSFAFSHDRQSEPKTLQLAATRHKPHITVHQLLVARVDTGEIKYTTAFHYDIRYSGVEHLTIALPAELAKTIRNDTPGIRDEPLPSASDPQLSDSVSWKFTGDTELIGKVTIRLAWEVSTGGLDVGKSTEFTIPRLEPMGADRSWGQIVLTKTETIDIVPTREMSGLIPIDPHTDLRDDTKVDDAARAFEFHDDWFLTVRATQYQLEEIKQSSIEQAVVRAVVTRSGQVAVQALYLLRSAQQRLAIRLPANVETDGISFDTDPLRINGMPVTLERGSDKRTFYVPLAGIDSTRPFLLELRYTMPGNHRAITLPSFPSDPAVQKVHLCVFLPNELAYLGARGPWTDELRWDYRGALRWEPVPLQSDDALINTLTEKLDTPKAIQDARSAAKTFHTDGNLLLFSALRPNNPPEGTLKITAMSSRGLNGLVFGLVAILGMMLVQRRFAILVFALGLLATVLILLGVFLPTFARQVTGSSLWQALALVVFVWMVAWLARRARWRALRTDKSGNGAKARKSERAEPSETSDRPDQAPVADEKQAAEAEQAEHGTPPSSQSTEKGGASDE